MKQPDVCIVRITDAKGNTRGTGFLVSADRLIATCAHVVEETEPCVAFPGGEPSPSQVVATDQAHDVAILQFQGELPDRAEPVRLGRSSGAYDRGFRSRGYRPLGGLEGIPAKGEVLNAVSEAPEYPDVRYMPLMLQTQHGRGGMSGAPVYIPDWDLVVGMITDYWDSLAYWERLKERSETGTPFADRDTAMATPSEAITALCPDIRLWEPPPEFPRPPIGIPFQAPPIPRYFVPRPEVSNDLKALLLANEAPAPGALVVSAIHGLGGIGKTTLVAALAHGPDLQARFPDGVLWATMGQEPEILSRLHEWIQSLGDYKFHPITVDGASAHLRTLLHDKACLLVVDDAWQADHVRSFLVGGDRCRVLVTTRDATLARKVGARLYELDVMTEAQALALFEERLGLLDGDRERAADLARELDYLPLALEVAAAQIGPSFSWSELRDTIRKTLVELAALNLDEATYRNKAQHLFFCLSLERLPADDQKAYAWLGVLPEDARINPSMAATLWHQSEIDACKRLRRLWHKALLESVGDDQYTIHDLLHVEAKLRLRDQVPLPEAHAALLARYRARTRNGLWHTLSDDGYIHEHLVWHMEQARQSEAIHNLLQAETPEGRNAWYETRAALNQTTGYLADVRHAWRLADEAFTAHPSSLALGMQCRYALMAASLNSLSSSIPPAFLLVLLRENVWKPRRAIAYAQMMTNHKQRVESLAALAIYLGRIKCVEEAKEAFRAIEDEQWRLKVIEDLCELMPNELLSELDQLKDKKKWVDGLALIVPHLPEGCFGKALQVVQSADNEYEYEKARALVVLAPHLSEELLGQALKMAETLRRSEARGKALVGFLPYLSGDLRSSIQKEALYCVEWAQPRLPDLLIELAYCLPEESRPPLFEKALKNASAMIDRWPRWYAYDILLYMASHLPLELKNVAFRKAMTLLRAQPSYEWDWIDPEFLQKLATLLAEDGHLADALEVTLMPRDDRARGESLQNLTPKLPTKAFRQVLSRRRAKESYEDVLVNLAPYLPAESVEEELTFVQGIEYRPTRENALAALLPRLAELGSHKQAVEETKKIEDEEYLAKALVGLAPYLPTELLETVLYRALGIEIRTLCRAEALEGLVPHLPAELLQRLPSAAWWTHVDREWYLAAMARLAELGYQEKALALALKDPEKAAALASIAPFLSEELLHDTVSEALAAAEWQVVIGLMPSLSIGLRKKILIAAQSIVNEEQRASVFVGLAPHLSTDLRKEIVIAAQTIVSEERRASVFVGLAPHLSTELLGELLAAMGRIQAHNVRRRALVDLSHQLPVESLNQVVRILKQTETSQGIELVPGDPESLYHMNLSLDDLVEAAQYVGDSDERVITKIYLAPHLPQDLVPEVLCLVHTNKSVDIPATALQRLTVRLAELACPEEALAVVRSIKQVDSKAQGLVDLEPHLPVRYKAETLKEAVEVARLLDRYSVLRWQLLCSVSVRLAELGYSCEALRVAHAIWDYDVFAEALEKMAPHLTPDLLRQELTIVRQIREDDKEDLWRRALALAHLASQLDEELKLDVRPDVVALLDHLPAFGWTQRMPTELVLARLSLYLPEEERIPVLRRALTEAQAVSTWDLPEAFDRVAPYLPKSLLLEALTAARKIADTWWRGRVLLALTPYVSKPLKTRVLKRAATLLLAGRYMWPAQQVDLLAEQASLPPDPLKKEMLHKVLNSLDRECRSAEEKAELLVRLSPHLHGSWSDHVFKAIRAVRDARKRVGLLIELMSKPGISDSREFYSVWHETLQILAVRTRQDLLVDIQSLAPVIAKLGGEEAITETFRAIQDVGRWWP